MTENTGIENKTLWWRESLRPKLQKVAVLLTALCNPGE